jgi:hypothetical protein
MFGDLTYSKQLKDYQEGTNTRHKDPQCGWLALLGVLADRKPYLIIKNYAIHLLPWW